VEGRGPIRVALNDGREFDAVVVLIDHRTDLAVLRLQGAEDLPVVQLANSDEVRPGDFALAIGNPLEVGQTITHGIVSAVGRTQIQLNSYEYYIQTDTPLNPGSSGGALLDTTGRLIGITVAIATETRGWQGIGFAVPANMVSFVLTSARNGDKVVRRPWLGAKLKPIVVANAARLGLRLPIGAVVERVMSDSPGANAGLQPGDVIVSVDGEPVRDPNTFDYRFTLKGTSGSTRIGLIRHGSTTSLNVQLKGAPDSARRDIAVISGPSPLKGATVATLTPAIAEELGVDAYAEGVAVIDVATDTPAEKYDFQRGDILRSANDKPITRSADVDRLLRNTRTATVEIDRDGDILLKHMLRTKPNW
jgi:S1-C subfamily serine protease